MKWLFDRDVLAAAVFVAIGLVFAATSLSYRIGMPSNMGPGLFPLGLSVLLIGLGTSVGLKALRKQAPDLIDRIEPRAPILVLVAVAIFAMALEPLGLPLTVALLVLTALFAAGPVHWLSALLTAVVLAALSVLIFVVGLSMPIALVPWPWQ